MRFDPAYILRPALAVGTVLTALCLTKWLSLQVTGGISPLFFAAVACSAYLGGLWAGLLATMLASLCTAFFFQVPYYSLHVGWDDALRLMAFMAVALMMSSLQHANVRALRRVEVAHAQAEAAHEDAIAAGLAKDRFLNILGHELRNPLAPVMSVVALRLEELSAPSIVSIRGESDGWSLESLREDFELIRRNIETEARLIDDLLDSRRIHTGKLRLVRQQENLGPLVREAVDAIRHAAEAKGLSLVLRQITPAGCRGQSPVIYGDATRLRQIFWNLLNNAVKFTASGRIAVSVRSAGGGSAAVVTVADTGPGMDASSAHTVFHPFVQLEPGTTADSASQRASGLGLGLGLSIVTALVNAHGGRVRVRARSGRGCVFRVHLPASWRADRCQLPAGGYPIVAGDEERGLRILIVDDHADTARIMARLLERLGHRVALADCVSGAIEIARSQPFDLLISDIGLGDGTGYELMTRLRADYGLAGIAVSGYATASDFAQSAAAGFAFHLVKPVAFDVLREHVERFRYAEPAA